MGEFCNHRFPTQNPVALVLWHLLAVAFYAMASLALTLAFTLGVCPDQAFASTDKPGLQPNSMPSEGCQYVVALRVDFPDYQFGEGDTLEALQGIIGAEADLTTPDVPLILGVAGDEWYPDENLGAYYYRSSYGKLTVKGKCFNYTANYTRDHYTDVSELFEEALSALDESVDFSQFDGDSDGNIDAVYLHFAGPDTGWGSTWWSKEFNYTKGATYDGKKLRNSATLHYASNTLDGAKTIIHETGHMLGLVDIYDSPNYVTPGTRGGTLTWTLMDNNTGDLTGFEKWLLGWIDDDAVIRVVTNSSGTTVLQGGTQIAHVDPAADGSSTYDLDLSSFDSSVVEQSGGFVVVSNEDEGRFASYYLIQYDTPQGCQAVSYYDPEKGSTTSIPCGFRVFRINSELSGSAYAHDVKSGLFNKLIELVDADYATDHTTSAVPCAKSGGFGCMLLAGDRLDCSTTLSTNFKENQRTGFTGITIEALSCGEQQGTIRIGYSPEGKPEFGEFSLTCDGADQVMNQGTISFTAPWEVSLNKQAASTYATVTIADKQYSISPVINGTTVTLTLNVPLSEFPANADVTVTFPEGLFLTGNVEGHATYSGEMTYSLTSKRQADVTSSNTLEGVSRQLLSACEQDGTVYLAWIGGDYSSGYHVELVNFPQDAPIEFTSRKIESLNLSETLSLKSYVSNLKAYADGYALLTIAHESLDRTVVGTDLYWLDLENARLIASASVQDIGCIWEIAPDGTAYGLSVDYFLGTRSCYEFQPQSDGTVAVKKANLRFADEYSLEGACDLGGGKIAIVTTALSVSVQENPEKDIHVLDVSALHEAFGSGEYITDEVLGKQECSYHVTVDAKTEFTAAAQLDDGGILMVGRQTKEGTDVSLHDCEYTLYRFGADGYQVSSILLEPKNPTTAQESSTAHRVYDYIAVGTDGNIAVMREQPVNAYNESRETILLNLDDLGSYETSYQCGRYLATESGTTGFWSDDGSTWLAFGFELDSSATKCYRIECTTDKGDTDPDEDSGADGDDDGGSEDADASGASQNGSQSAGRLAATGDSAPITVAIMLAIVSSALLAALLRKAKA